MMLNQYTARRGLLSTLVGVTAMNATRSQKQLLLTLMYNQVLWSAVVFQFNVLSVTVCV